MSTTFQNRLELFNDGFLLFQSYFIFAFTDYIIDQDVKFNLGYIFCYLVITVLIANFAIIIYSIYQQRKSGLGNLKKEKARELIQDHQEYIDKLLENEIHKSQVDGLPHSQKMLDSFVEKLRKLNIGQLKCASDNIVENLEGLEGKWAKRANSKKLDEEDESEEEKKEEEVEEKTQDAIE